MTEGRPSLRRSALCHAMASSVDPPMYWCFSQNRVPETHGWLQERSPRRVAWHWSGLPDVAFAFVSSYPQESHRPCLRGLSQSGQFIRRGLSD